MSKPAVVERLRQADQWFERYGGAPGQWMRDLVRDALQELEGESGSLWLQWTTGRDGHVRMFVKGEMGPRELDSLLEMLQLSRSWMEQRDTKRTESPPSVAAVREDAGAGTD